MDDRYEMVLWSTGLLELRDREEPNRWIRTDEPVELEP